MNEVLLLFYDNPKVKARIGGLEIQFLTDFNWASVKPFVETDGERQQNREVISIIRQADVK